MEKLGFGRWMLVVTWALITQHASGSGKLAVKFIRFHGNGQDTSGRCCEFPFCGNACDPYFHLCLDRHGGNNRMEECSIYTVSTGIFHEQNGITFTGSLAGVPNPIVVSLASIPNYFNIKVRVMDSDPTNDHDHMDDLMYNSDYLEPSYNGVEGDYRQLIMSVSPRVSLTIEIRSYCDVNYYGDNCAKKCVPNNGGYYTCDSNGDKVCSIGWSGVHCNIDIDECETGVCKHVENCTNLPGAFTCDCTEDYKGVLCDEPIHECVVNPCENGGTCHGNETTEFVCDCLPWWGGETCKEAINPCDVAPCQNNATCLVNNVTSTGFACTCEFGWTGKTCESTTTTSSTTTPTTTTVFVVSYGDPYHITLVGVIDHTNRPLLEKGLIELINDLGGVQGKVYVKVKPEVIPIKQGLTTTFVEFHSGGENGPISRTIVDYIFRTHSDKKINTFLPLPLYRPTFGKGTFDPQKQEQHGVTWINSNWYVIVIPILIAIILVACIAAFLIITRRKRKEKAAAFLRCESNVEPVSPTDMAFENVLYHETHQQRQSDVLDGGEVTLNQGALHQTGACADELNPYAQPVQYDTPLKQAAGACNGVSQYQNSNLATLDTRCEAGSNDYTDFTDLDGAKAKEENPYQELDDVMAQKIALSVGLPEESDGNISTVSTDDEDDIDKIKASFKDQTDA